MRFNRSNASWIVLIVNYFRYCKAREFGKFPIESKNSAANKTGFFRTCLTVSINLLNELDELSILLSRLHSGIKTDGIEPTSKEVSN